MPLYSLDYSLLSKSREKIRQEVINLFLSELPGTGTGDLSTRYHYTVERYSDYSIVIKRPTGLNKGFDFTVNVTGFYFKKQKRYSNPSHKDVICALRYAKDNYPEQYVLLKRQIECIFNCKSFSVDETKDIFFMDGDNILRPISIILMVIKWLFIEQDITYWNWSGRNMLHNKLISEGLL